MGVGVRMGGVSGYVSMYGGGWTYGNWCRHGWVDGWGVESMMIIRFDLINRDQNKKNVRYFCLFIIVHNEWNLKSLCLAKASNK